MDQVAESYTFWERIDLCTLREYYMELLLVKKGKIRVVRNNAATKGNNNKRLNPTTSSNRMIRINNHKSPYPQICP